MPQHMQNMAQAMAHNQAHGHVQFQPGPPNAQQQQMMQMQGIPMPQQPQQPAQQQPNMTMGPRPGAMPQAQPSASQPIPQQQNQYNPAPHENELIIQMANQLQASAPPQRLQAIQNSMRQINPEQRENLARQGLDPVHAYFRREAMKRFWEMKRAQASSQGAPAAQSAAMTNGITRPPQDMARSMGQPASGPQQNFETPFDQIVGQQQDGLRSQEAGQVVVPASNPQANIDQRNAARANAPQQVSMQNGGTRVLQNANANHPQTQTFWSSQGAQRNANPGAGVNGNTAAANFSNANQPPSNVLQGQPGGLDNQITRTPSQTPGMPNLNKAAAPPGQTPNMWSHRTPQLGQGTPQATPVVQPGMQQPAERPEATQQRPLMIPNMPPQMQQHLATLPEDQQRSFLMNLRRHQQHHQQMQQQANQQAAKAANARAAMSDSLPMSSQPSQPGMQPGTTAAMPNQNMAVSQAMMHKANGLQSAFAPQLSTYGGPARQQPGSGQQPPQQRGTPQHPGSNANPPPSLTKEQIRQMDQRIFPANLLREGMAHIPQEVKTWGQLKEFAMKRAQQLPQGLLPKLEHLQAIQYRTLQQGPGPAQSGSLPPGSAQQQQAPFAQMVSQPNGQAPIAAPRPPNGMRIPQPTAQEVQVMRARLPPTAQSASDDQIRIFLMKQKHETLTRSMQQGQNNQMVNGVSKSHQDIPNQVQGDTSASDVNQLPQTGQAKSQTQQSQKGAGPASKQSQGNRNTSSVVKQTQKGVKRNSNDDVVEVPNPSLANSQASLQAPKQNAQTQEEKARANIKSSVNQSTTDQSQNAASQNARPPGVPNLPKEELDRRDARLRQLMTEVGQNQPLRRPVPMSPQTRTEMGQKLQGMRPMIARMESSLPSFFRSNANENFARQLIETVSRLSLFPGSIKRF